MTESLYANDFSDLYSIHQKEFNIGFMNIETIEPSMVKSYLEINFDKLPSMFKCIISKDNFEESIRELDNLYYILDDNDEKLELINFIKTLVSNFADITDSTDMGVSLEKVTSDMCRYFHCDMNHLRMVYSLLGPGTLWAEENNLRRNFLGKGKNDEVIIDPTKIFQVPPKTLTLLKGQGHPTAHGKAVVHASPIISKSKEKRVLLRIESIF
jgi:hypothetical protein